MSVFYENHDHETEADRPVVSNRGPGEALRRLTARAGQIGAEGMDFERVEGFIHLALAFAIVAGAALILKTAFVPEAPSAEVAKATKPAEPAPAVARVLETEPVARVAESQPAPSAPEAPSAESTPAVPSSLLSPQPMAPPAAPEISAAAREPAPPASEPAAAAPEPLAPPPADLRERLAARTETPESAAPASPDATAYQASPAEEPSAPVSPGPASEEPAAPAREADAGHMAKCFFKLAGKVQNSGPCRVTHAGAAVVLQLPGKPLEIAPVHGRVWTATLGGRSLGKVYKTGACWGAKGFYACEKG